MLRILTTSFVPVQIDLSSMTKNFQSIAIWSFSSFLFLFVYLSNKSFTFLEYYKISTRSINKGCYKNSNSTIWIPFELSPIDNMYPTNDLLDFLNTRVCYHLITYTRVICIYECRALLSSTYYMYVTSARMNSAVFYKQVYCTSV